MAGVRAAVVPPRPVERHLRGGKKLRAVVALVAAGVLAVALGVVLVRGAWGLAQQPLTWAVLAALLAAVLAVAHGESLGGLGDRVRGSWEARRELRRDAAELARMRRLRADMAPREWRAMVLALVERRDR